MTEVVFNGENQDLVVEIENQLPEIVVDFEDQLPELVVEFSEVGLTGAPGKDGVGTSENTLKIFSYVMPVAQTTATFTHDLGHDPVAVQVFLDGQQADEFSVTFPLSGHSVQVGFDIPVKAIIRLI